MSSYVIHWLNNTDTLTSQAELIQRTVTASQSHQLNRQYTMQLQTVNIAILRAKTSNS